MTDNELFVYSVNIYWTLKRRIFHVGTGNDWTIFFTQLMAENLNEYYWSFGFRNCNKIALKKSVMTSIRAFTTSF